MPASRPTPARSFAGVLGPLASCEWEEPPSSLQQPLSLFRRLGVEALEPGISPAPVLGLTELPCLWPSDPLGLLFCPQWPWKKGHSSGVQALHPSDSILSASHPVLTPSLLPSIRPSLHPSQTCPGYPCSRYPEKGPVPRALTGGSVCWSVSPARGPIQVNTGLLNGPLAAHCRAWAGHLGAQCQALELGGVHSHWARGIVLALQAATPASPPQNKAVSSASPHSQRRRVQGVFLVPWEKGRAPAGRGGWGRSTEGRVEFLVSRFRCGRNARALLPGNPESTLSPARPLRQKHTCGQSQVEGLPGVLWEALLSLGVPCLCSPTTGSHPVCLVSALQGAPTPRSPTSLVGAQDSFDHPGQVSRGHVSSLRYSRVARPEPPPAQGLAMGTGAGPFLGKPPRSQRPQCSHGFSAPVAWEALPWPRGLLCPGLEPLPCCSALSSLEARKRYPFPSPNSLSLASLPQVMGTNFQAR